jgi:uncharacterized protein
MAKGNGRPFVDMLADDVEGSIIGSTEWSGTFPGRSSVVTDLLRPLAEQTTARTPWRRHALSRKGTLVAGGGLKSQRDEARPGLSQPILLIFEMRDAKAVRITEYCDTALVDRVLVRPRN